MLRDGKPAIFASHVEARRAADMHVRDGYPNSDRINDGYTWRVDPYIEKWFAARGRWPARANDRASIAG